MKRVRLYRRGPRLYIHAVSWTADRRAVMAAPIAFLSLEDEESFLGETLLSTLAASRTGARDPGDAIKKQILDAARSRSWTSFMRGTYIVDVEMGAQGLRLLTASNALRRPLDACGSDQTSLSSNALASDLGRAVKTILRALEPRKRQRP